MDDFRDRDETLRSLRQLKKERFDELRWRFSCDYPSKGRAIAEIVEPFHYFYPFLSEGPHPTEGTFYGGMGIWRPVPGPSLPDLEARIKQAIFWKEVRAVRCCNEAKIEFPWHCWERKPRNWKKKEKEYYDHLLQHDRDLVAQIKLPFWASLLEVPKYAALAQRFKKEGDVLSNLDQLGYLIENFTFKGDFMARMCGLASCHFNDLIPVQIPCALVVLGDMEGAALFKPLLDIIARWNFPFGFDQDDNLVVLTA